MGLPLRSYRCLAILLWEHQAIKPAYIYLAGFLLMAFILLACMIAAVSYVIRALRASTEHDEFMSALRDYAYHSDDDGDWPNVPRH